MWARWINFRPSWEPWSVSMRCGKLVYTVAQHCGSSVHTASAENDGSNCAALKRVASSTIYSTWSPLIYVISKKIPSLKRKFSAPLVTRNLVRTFWIRWNGLQRLQISCSIFIVPGALSSGRARLIRLNSYVALEWKMAMKSVQFIPREVRALWYVHRCKQMTVRNQIIIMYYSSPNYCRKSSNICWTRFTSRLNTEQDVNISQSMISKPSSAGISASNMSIST